MNVARKTEQSFRDAAKRINAAAKGIGQGSAGRGLRLIGEEIMTDCKASRPGAGVPRDTGALAGSGSVDGPVQTPLGPLVELSFGGAAAPYALAQHEILTYHHTVGEARYLVRAMERWKPGGSAAMEALKENAEWALKMAGKGA